MSLHWKVTATARWQNERNWCKYKVLKVARNSNHQHEVLMILVLVFICRTALLHWDVVSARQLPLSKLHRTKTSNTGLRCVFLHPSPPPLLFLSMSLFLSQFLCVSTYRCISTQAHSFYARLHRSATISLAEKLIKTKVSSFNESFHTQLNVTSF